MRTIDELIGTPRVGWTKEEKAVVAKFPSLQWMIQFKSEWNKITTTLNKESINAKINE